MEFDFRISEILSNEITKIDCHLIHQESAYGSRHAHLQLIIDKLGDASSKAQGLHRTITTCCRLKDTNHLLYIMKDHKSISEKDVAVGILKVGHKKLFLQDPSGVQHEMTPLCVLDFYIHESYQRKGCGKRLFQYMLKDQKVKAHELAIDKPSPKLLSFLSRHYDLNRPIHQRNNFTIFQEIFPNKSGKESEILQAAWSKTRSTEPIDIVMHSMSSTSSPSSYRQSYPPLGALRPGDSSVASVVFGQRCFQEFKNGEDKVQQQLTKSVLGRQLNSEPYREPSKCFSGVDSSLNIFGIPSPDNRPRLESHD